MQIPAAPRIATSPDRVQPWAQERREQNGREQDRQDEGKQQGGEPPRPGNQGGGNQDPPTPPKGNDPNPTHDGSDHGGGGGGEDNPGWRLDRGDLIDSQVAMMAHAIRTAIMNRGKRQANPPISKM